APPVRLPVNRDGVWYQSWNPTAAYGNPGGGFIANYPQVYQPTDTTQLGYYYHKVPTWQTRTDMIPGTPDPRAYHLRGCLGAGPACQTCPGGVPQYHSAMPRYAPMAPVAMRPAPPRQQPVVRQASQPAGKKKLFSFSSISELFEN
ncbi:MAG: hypothetical protein KDA85_01755, partial [Planctomycetaceae bacterium]|nr:hypothetical protein [Planctomycetaceae bacterium]